MAAVKGNITFSEGIHYWVLNFDKFKCCTRAGVVGEDDNLNSSKIEPFEFENHFTGGHIETKGFLLKVTFVLDMTGDLPVLRAYENEKKIPFLKMQLPKKRYSPAVYFKHDLRITILETGTGVPKGLKMENDV